MKLKQINEILDALNSCQEKAKTRTISEYRLKEELYKLKYKKCFCLSFDGGAVSKSYRYRAESTCGYIKYDRKSKYFEYKIYRNTARQCAYGDGGYMTTEFNRKYCISVEKLYKIADYLKKREERKYPEYKIYIDYDKLTFKYQLIVKALGEEYHFDYRKKPYANEKNLKKALREGKRRIVQRKRKDLIRQNIFKIKEKIWNNNENLKKIYVTFNDSINSGNCYEQSKETKNKIIEKYGQISMISADKLLEIRDDMYVRRAIEMASIRYVSQFS
jgi:hypothetical protein